MQNRNTITIVTVLTVTVILLIPPQLQALSTGIIQHSGNPGVNGGNTCSLCHSGGVAPTLQLSGPVNIEAGSTNTYSLTMSGGQQNLAGFNISTSQGSLSASLSGIGLESNELKHTQPFNVGTTGGEWTFSFIAPAMTGQVTLYAAGVSTNGDSQLTGDGVTITSFTVDITPAQSLLPPTAVPGGPYFAVPNEVIAFDAVNSSDGDGTVSRYLWDFGDGTDIGQGQTIEHAYPNEGSFTVTLAATDNDGLTGAAATIVTVSTNAGAAQGEALFNQFCSGCHTLASTLAGRTIEQVSSALATVSKMQFLTLTQEQIQLIVEFLATGGGEPPSRPTDGPGLYGAFCSLCHGANGRGASAKGVTGAPLQMITEAITNITAMQTIDLSVEELQLVAEFLVNGGSGNLPIDGAGLYSVFCSVCHGVDGRGDTYKVVTGTSTSFINRALNNINLMSQLSINSTQIQSIGTFLASGGGGTKPNTGSELYYVFCQTCHGPDGNGGPEEDVRGSSTNEIRSELSGTSNMRQLRSYLTNSDINAIANFLGGSGGG